MLHIAIVEDEWTCDEELTACLERYAKEYGEEFHIRHFKRGAEFLFQYEADTDLVFMDVDMPEMNGFETAAKLRQMDPDVVLIFITFLAKYAYRGYEVDAMDYIIKPVRYETLRLKIDKAIDRCRKKLANETFVETKEGLVRISISRLSYVEIMGHHIVYHTDTGDVTDYGTLKSVEKNLPEGQFCRCNSGYLVNLRCVTSIEGDTVVVGSKRLPMSRTLKKEFMEALQRYFS